MTLPPAKTVLVVDDEESILSLSKLTLDEEGYQTLIARNGEEALAVSEKHEGDIDVVVIDVVMPGMSGPHLAEQLRIRRPGARVLFTSGYGDGAALALQQNNTDCHYLKKPFGPDQLTETVGSLLAT